MRLWHKSPQLRPRHKSEPKGGLLAMFTKPRPRLSRDARLGLTLALPVALIMGGLVFLPLLSTILDSLFRVEPMKPGTPFVGLKNYATLMADGTVQQI